LQLAPAFCKFPGVEPAIGRQSRLMRSCAVLRRLEARPPREIGWRTDDGHAHLRPNMYGDRSFASNLLKKAANFRAWREAHSSIRIQESPPSSSSAHYESKTRCRAGDNRPIHFGMFR